MKSATGRKPQMHQQAVFNEIVLCKFSMVVCYFLVKWNWQTVASKILTKIANN